MKKFFSILCTMVLLNAIITPITLAADADQDKQLADLLDQLAGSDAKEDVAPTPEVKPAPPAPTPTQEVVQIKKDEAGNAEHDAAEDILDSIEGDKWTYAGTDKIEISDIDDSSVTITITERLFDGAAVPSYKIFYSESTLSTTEDFNSILSRVVNIESSGNGMATLKLDNLESEKTYFILVAPVNPIDATDDALTMISSEVKFTTLPKPVIIDSTTQVFQDVSHTQNGDTVSMTWTPTDLVEKGSIFIKHYDDQAFTQIGTVNMTSGKYTFTVVKAGNYSLKIHGVSNDGQILGQEQIVNIKVEAFEPPVAPIASAPQVGPATDLIMGLIIFSFLVYMIYRFRRSES